MSADVLSGSPFTEHTIESAPPRARRFLTATRDQLGYLPAAMARLAASPQLLDGFLKLTAIARRSRRGGGAGPAARSEVAGQPT